MNKMKIPRLFKTEGVQRPFIVAAESLEGVVASATLTNIPADNVHVAQNRLELRLEGRTESFVVEGASYRLDKGDRVVVYSAPAISGYMLETLLANPSDTDKSKKISLQYSVVGKNKKSLFDKISEKADQLIVKKEIFNKNLGLEELSKPDITSPKSKYGLTQTQASAALSLNKYITTRVVGLQVLDEKGGVKFQAVHERGYAFMYKP